MLENKQMADKVCNSCEVPCHFLLSQTMTLEDETHLEETHHFVIEKLRGGMSPSIGTTTTVYIQTNLPFPGVGMA